MYWRKEGKMKFKIGAYKGLIRTLPLVFKSILAFNKINFEFCQA